MGFLIGLIVVSSVVVILAVLYDCAHLCEHCGYSSPVESSVWRACGPTRFCIQCGHPW